MGHLGSCFVATDRSFCSSIDLSSVRSKRLRAQAFEWLGNCCKTMYAEQFFWFFYTCIYLTRLILYFRWLYLGLPVILRGVSYIPSAVILLILKKKLKTENQVLVNAPVEMQDKEQEALK